MVKSGLSSYCYYVIMYMSLFCELLLLLNNYLLFEDDIVSACVLAIFKVLMQVSLDHCIIIVSLSYCD